MPIAPDTLGAAFVHELRSGEGGYFVVIVDGEIHAYDRDTGEEATVSTPDGTDYLTSDAGFKAVTIGDKTYILNRDVVVADDGTTAPDQAFEALVTVREADYSTTYTLILNGTSYTVTTPDATDPSVRGAIGTVQIAQDLVSALSVLAATFIISSVGSTIHIKRVNGADFTLTATDGLSNTALSIVKGSVALFVDLPKTGWDQMIVNVKGVPESTADDYWVKFVASYVPTNLADFLARGIEGTWQECPAPGTPLALDPATMPWVLEKTGDNTFSFHMEEWAPRTAGDLELCPLPSFVGQIPDEIFFTENRLGLTAGKSVVLSRVGKLTNFMRETATALLASDPIDITSTYPNAAPFESAVEWNGMLVLCSSGGHQLALSGNPALTPMTVRMDHLSSFPMGKIRPAVMGKYLYFARKKTAHTEILQYFLMPNGRGDAVSSTEDVPQYIPGSPKQIVGDAVQEFLAVLTDTGDGALWVYSFHYDNDEANPYAAPRRTMSSWSKWIFPEATVLAMSMLDGVLSLIMQREDGVYLEKIDLGNLVLNGVEDIEDRIGFGTTVPFISRWQLSAIYPRDHNTDVAETKGRLQIRYLTFNVHNTTDFTITVTPDGGRPPTIYTFHSLTPYSGEYTIPIMTRNSSVSIEMSNSTTGGCAFDNVDWLGDFTDIARRV